MESPRDRLVRLNGYPQARLSPKPRGILGGEGLVAACNRVRLRDGERFLGDHRPPIHRAVNIRSRMRPATKTSAQKKRKVTRPVRKASRLARRLSSKCLAYSLYVMTNAMTEARIANMTPRGKTTLRVTSELPATRFYSSAGLPSGTLRTCFFRSAGASKCRGRKARPAINVGMTALAITVATSAEY